MVAAGQAHTADRDGTVGLVQKEKGRAAPRKKRKRLRDVGTAENWEVGFRSSSGGKGLKDF
jgi:hypothetical protein